MAKPENLFIPGLWERINQEIYDQNRTKKDIAAQCGFDRKVLEGYDDKTVNLSLPYLMLLCKELNISADYLLFGKKSESSTHKGY